MPVYRRSEVLNGSSPLQKWAVLAMQAYTTQLKIDSYLGISDRSRLEQSTRANSCTQFSCYPFLTSRRSKAISTV
ncbi:uncharacterized protein FOMMEDRAFT_23673 [Fomitiporia mediterranea MF3/22]|uniref:uncharacterized protein n=1 Tax=Fomitiporia mediterranea (strain MF3/22) TaxID=694068 RepID=UPI0004408D0C|nr:uncharacterized protein FOMMEDRAFT_23673 [Fomitiporia mediterranea MF3/22]EJC98422.1 hypothetical protein FOMMEDRAFT_23673 [Fomitiporia mediterranea MF3/22]